MTILGLTVVSLNHNSYVNYHPRLVHIMLFISYNLCILYIHNIEICKYSTFFVACVNSQDYNHYTYVMLVSL